MYMFAVIKIDLQPLTDGEILSTHKTIEAARAVAARIRERGSYIHGNPGPPVSTNRRDHQEAHFLDLKGAKIGVSKIPKALASVHAEGLTRGVFTKHWLAPVSQYCLQCGSAACIRGRCNTPLSQYFADIERL